MADIFPDIAPDYGYSFTPRFKTDVLGPTDGDYTQRRRRRTSPLYQAVLSYNNITAANERTLMEFFEARDGGYDSFVFFDILSRDYTGVSVGTGDGSTTVFTMSARDITDETVYVNGTPTSVTVNNRAGANGQDQIIFSLAPGNTLAITADYSGEKYLAICVFDTDALDSAIVNFNRHQLAQIIINQVNQ